MHGIVLGKTTVVFDLDDTLYPEADYVESGIKHVCNHISSLYGLDLCPVLLAALADDATTDWMSMACELAGLPQTVKESLLWMYRLHPPSIQLSASCNLALRAIQSSAKAVAVLTDGRSITQRMKLKALGLSYLPAYISEDHGSYKPAPERFKLIQEQFRADHYVYVADNVKKDFVGCNPLGWIGIGMLGGSRNIHSQVVDCQPQSALPSYWVNNWEELTSLLLNS